MSSRALLFTVLILTLIPGGCATSVNQVVGPSPRAGMQEPRPAREDRAHIGSTPENRPPEWWELLLIIPGFFFAGVAVRDDVVSGPAPTLLLTGELRQRQWDRVRDDEWLPPKAVEALSRAFSGTEPRADLLSPDARPPVDPKVRPTPGDPDGVDSTDGADPTDEGPTEDRGKAEDSPPKKPRSGDRNS